MPANVSATSQDDLLAMSLDENSASSEMMLSRYGRLVDRCWMVGDSENHDSGSSPGNSQAERGNCILYIDIVPLNGVRSALTYSLP